MEQYAGLKQQEQLCQQQLNTGNYNVGICFDLKHHESVVNNRTNKALIIHMILIICSLVENWYNSFVHKTTAVFHNQ